MRKSRIFTLTATLAFAFTLIFFGVTKTSTVLAAPKTEMERLRATLPENALTLGLVLSLAIKNSDNFRMVQSELHNINVPQLLAESAFDTQIELTQSWLKNENEPSNPASPVETDGHAFSIGASRYFSSGTALGLSFSQGYNDIGFPTGSLFQVSPYYETQTSLNLKQKLWADSFGYASRRALRSARLQTEAQKINFQSAIEKWTLNTTNFFYQAWFSQKQTLATRDGLSRRERLLKSTKIRLDRGTAEVPDYLQIESAHLRSKASKLEAEKNLDDQWRRLIVTLKLPSDFMLIDSASIPLKIDDETIPLAQQICRSFREKGVPPGAPLELQKTRLLHESALLNWEKTKNEVWPDLQLQGSYFLNGISPNAGSSQSETINGDHPGWSVGLVLTMPLEFKKQKAALSKATAEKIQLEALKSSADDNQSLAWLNECSNLERLTETLKYAQAAYQNQKRRADLEERRFRLGRSSTFNVIQAGDDATEAEIFMHGTDVQLRQSAWRVLELDVKILDQLKHYIQKHGGQWPAEMESHASNH